MVWLRAEMLVMALVLALLVPGEGLAQGEDIIQASVIGIVQKGCGQELASHCSEVRPGGGGLASCLSAYRHKLSPTCQSALGVAGKHMSASLAALKQAVLQCKDDIAKRCPGLVPVRRNVLACVAKLKGPLKAACRKGLASFRATLKR